jgi:hypothetical protein
MISANVLLVYTSYKECVKVVAGSRQGVVLQLGVWAGGLTELPGGWVWGITTPHLNNKSSTSQNITQGLLTSQALVNTAMNIRAA